MQAFFLCIPSYSITRKVLIFFYYYFYFGGIQRQRETVKKLVLLEEQLNSSNSIQIKVKLLSRKTTVWSSLFQSRY